MKKSDADFEQFQNFRPISNVKVVSKLLEKAVVIQLTDHVMGHHLDETFQSAYKNFHSTETALVRVQNDILCAIDNNESVILLLLNLSDAFDTVDHSILLSRLRDRFGVNGTAVAWFESYLTSRTYFVRVNDGRSTQRSLERGVPQGSVLFFFISSIHHPLLISSSSSSYSIIYTLTIPGCIYTYFIVTSPKGLFRNNDYITLFNI